MLDTFVFLVYNSRVMNNYGYAELFSIYKSLLTDKQSDIFSLHIECDLSLGEISELKNISRQAVSDTITKTKEILSSYEEKLSLLKKRQALEQICSTCADEDIKNQLLKILGE